MLKSITKTLLGAAFIVGAAAPHAFAETTLNALFMAQAAYSEADVRAMTDAFTKANPDIKVNLEFVPMRACTTRPCWRRAPAAATTSCSST